MVKRPVALVTGASRGIGRAIAEELASAGYDLVAVAKHADRLSRVAQAVGAKYGVTVHSKTCDIGDPGQMQALLQYCLDNDIHIDVLVNCAGIFIEGSLADSTLEAYEATMTVNIRGMYCLTKLLLPLMEGRPKPRIVIVGSTAGLEAYPVGAIYSLSKWATRGYAVNLRHELIGRRIGVILLSLGGTLTDLWEGEELPPNRLITPADVGKLVCTAVSLSEQAVVEEIVVRPMLGDIHE